MNKNNNNIKPKFVPTYLRIFIFGIIFILSAIFLYFGIAEQAYALIPMAVMLWVFAIGLYSIINNLSKETQNLLEENESIKNYNEEILIDINEYVAPNEGISTKEGKFKPAKGKFLEINKSNELFKHGKVAIGTVIEIIDLTKYETDLYGGIGGWYGHVYLVVEFKNEKGLTYKVKTPAISNKLFQKVDIGQNVQVYYDDTNKRPSLEEYIYKDGKREKVFYHNIDFYVTTKER